MQDKIIDCACVIHGTTYTWDYVEKLHSMVTRHLSWPIRLHVFTESDRPVPAPMIKHDLEIWPGIGGPRSAWWYKMQLFNPENFAGPLLYFDLDVIISGNLDWIVASDLDYFWAIRDFKHLWRPESRTLNSSVMYWDTTKFQNIWRQFSNTDLLKIVAKYKGDQDFLTDAVDTRRQRFFDADRVHSWRWQAHDGGLDFATRKYKTPGSGAVVAPTAQILICHGKPKPHEILDEFVVKHWR